MIVQVDQSLKAAESLLGHVLDMLACQQLDQVVSSPLHNLGGHIYLIRLVQWDELMLNQFPIQSIYDTFGGHMSSCSVGSCNALFCKMISTPVCSSVP